MTNRPLAMPDYVARLVRMPLAQMNLEPSDLEDDIVSCSLLYESGDVLSLVVMCIAKRGWFRDKPMLVVSAVTMEGTPRTVKVHFRETMDLPTSPSDLLFTTRLSAKVRAIAWTISATSNMGKCLAFRDNRPDSSSVFSLPIR